MRYVGLGRDILRSHFVFRPRHAPEWLRARFLPVVFLANEEELTGKTFTTSLNTTNPNAYVKLIFLRTSPLTRWVPCDGYIRHQNDHLSGRMTDISVVGEWQVVGVGGTRPLRNVLGETLEGRFSFEARNYLFSFQNYVLIWWRID